MAKQEDYDIFPEHDYPELLVERLRILECEELH